ncbi:MAG: TetR/AcrR family transcriptional regulator [Sneathiella sp.]
MRPQKGKQKIFDAAIKLFAQQGYFATTIEEVTKEAGVSKGLVYNYFVSKEDLLSALIVQSTERMESIALTLDPTASLDEALSVFIENLFNFLQSEKQFLKLQLTLMLMPELQEIIGNEQRHRAKMLLKITHNWFEQAAVPHPKHKARLFLALLDGVALHYLAIYDRYPLKSMKTHLMKTAKDLCKPQEQGISK